MLKSHTKFEIQNPSTALSLYWEKSYLDSEFDPFLKTLKSETMYFEKATCRSMTFWKNFNWREIVILKVHWPHCWCSFHFRGSLEKVLRKFKNWPAKVTLRKFKNWPAKVPGSYLENIQLSRDQRARPLRKSTHHLKKASPSRWGTQASR